MFDRKLLSLAYRMGCFGSVLCLSRVFWGDSKAHCIYLQDDCADQIVGDHFEIPHLLLV